MANNSDTIIKIEHLSKAFGEKVVLDNINLDIRRGEFITLLGPSGCGKTTILSLISGLLKPTSGTISYIDGKQGIKIGYMLQKDHLLPWRTTEENMRLPKAAPISARFPAAAG